MKFAGEEGQDEGDGPGAGRPFCWGSDVRADVRSWCVSHEVKEFEGLLLKSFLNETRCFPFRNQVFSQQLFFESEVDVLLCSFSKCILRMFTECCYLPCCCLFVTEG